MEDDDDQESVRTLDEEMDNASSEGAARLIKSPTASNSNAGNGTFAINCDKLATVNYLHWRTRLGSNQRPSVRRAVSTLYLSGSAAGVRNQYAIFALHLAQPHVAGCA